MTAQFLVCINNDGYSALYPADKFIAVDLPGGGEFRDSTRALALSKPLNKAQIGRRQVESQKLLL
jgi:hypothetical protein